jgi:hypothetical protein
MKSKLTILALGCCAVFMVATSIGCDSNPGSASNTTPAAPKIPKMKMTTDIPVAITTPDKVETRLGTLNFVDGFPDDATVQKVYERTRMHGPGMPSNRRLARLPFC